MQRKKEIKTYLSFRIWTIFFGFCFLLMHAAIGNANTGNSGIKTQVNGFYVELSFMSEKAKVGENEIMVKLLDTQNKPVANAKVSVTAEMDHGPSMAMDSNSMEGMKMDDQTAIPLELKENHDHHGMGEYMATVNFDYDGKWVINVGFETGGQSNQAAFELNVVKGGPNWYIIGGFIAIIALIVIIAAIMKSRQKTVVPAQN